MKIRSKGSILIITLFLTAMGIFYEGLFAQQDVDSISIGKYQVISSKILKEERRILIHLPRNYEKNVRKYPVFYMLYGNHMTTYFAQAVSILDGLGPIARIPEMILIGIENTDRYRDLLPEKSDGSATGIHNFLNFLKKELIPYVEKNFRCKKYRMIMGPQAGANFVFYTLFKDPQIFNAGIITNPFRWRGGRDLMMKQAKQVLMKNKEFNKTIFITYSDGDELEREGAKLVDNFFTFVQERKPDNFNLYLNFKENWDEFSAPLGIRLGLKSIFKNYPISPENKIMNLDDLKKHYHSLSEEYGYDVEMPEHQLVVTYDILEDQRKTKEAMEILNYIMDKNPLSGNGLWRMANLHQQNGNIPGAILNLEKMVKVIGSDSGMIKNRLNYFKKMVTSSAAYALEQEIAKSGLEQAKKRYQIINMDAKLYFNERELNSLGYRLFNKKQTDEALFIFKINMEKFPQSANVYDSMGEVLFHLGKYEESERNYQKSLELNPKNTNAAKYLVEISKIKEKQK
jgi:predicted alpha/beta superfamily hydrolase